ncbi:hypothetical protein DAEQUDRAFT_749495 [Daedalea quercina L-15889]|uniref:Sld7 C-terminal domain-containing protein n=1 Tax=Daedalea quercina L-15889 TaxID=1314783 RepID=A0A165SSS0_9APHY|nr:hypothetical protein DAEQUDRAFT_749495 [Daedalea quercina L-15889]
MDECYKDDTRTTQAATQSTHRLLYRGALSLPDSNMVLDGLSFTASLGASALAASQLNDSNFDLFNHPLALALESMRGRPTLHLVGAVEMDKLWVDEKSSGVVQLDVHPKATLSRLYFENIFCLEPIVAPTGRSHYGVRISLSDTGDSSAEDILVYAQLESASPDVFDGPLTPPSTSTATPQCIRLLVARILPGPPPMPVLSRPRPDDPTPRVPTLPTPTTAKRKRDISPSIRDKKLKPSTGKEQDAHDAEALRRARDTMIRLPKAVSAPAVPKSSGAKGGKQAEFKVPSLPPRVSSNAGSGNKTRQASVDGDAVESPVDAFSSANITGGEFATFSADQKEKTNKTVVKQAVVRCLSDHAITKQHPEFHDVFQYIYRGTCFSLRSQMRSTPVDLWSVYKLVDAHAKMYVPGAGA